MAEPLACFHAIVTGRVQGVCFRAYTQSEAAQLGLTGWVQNLWDGSVEVLAEGSRPALEQLLGSLHRGPQEAYVTNVAVDWQPATGEFTRFEVRY